MKHIKLKFGDDKDLIDVYTHYQKTFPPNERKSLNHLQQLMIKEKYQLILLTDSSSKTRLGYAFIYHINEPEALWLDFIAIDESCRGLGYGSLFIEKIIHHYENIAGILIEVEKVESNNIIQARRLKFYERLGAQYLPIDYKLPTPDGSLPMHLMFIGSDTHFTWNQATLMGAITSAHEYIHHDLPHAEKIFKKMLLK